jgi:hypothetical protein
MKQGKLKEPVIVEYDHNNKWGVLSEGHHRVLAAEQAGISHLPTRVTRGFPNANARYKREGKGGPMSIKQDAMIGMWGEHVPANPAPSSFEDFPHVAKEKDEAK